MTFDSLASVRKVLLVDDDDDAREVYGLGLSEGAGWAVVYASSGKEALELVEVERPDVVLLDVMMPEMDGFSTFERLRTQPHGLRVPVIFVSAGAGPDERKRMRTLGAHGVLDKPLDPLALPQRVLEFLRQGPPAPS